MKRGAVFFDRDGVLNVDLGYVGSPDRFVWQERAIEAIRLVNDLGFLVIVVTNQSGVARGYFSARDVDLLHIWMNRELSLHGAHIDAFYVCPFHADAVDPDYRVVDHWDRKPNPGMILRAIKEHEIDPSRSFLVGDMPSDLQAADRAGIRSFGYGGGDLAAFLSEHLGCR